MAVFRIVSDLFRALQLHFYQVKYMSSHIAGRPADRILKSKAITIALVKKRRIDNKPDFFVKPLYRPLLFSMSSPEH